MRRILALPSVLVASILLAGPAGAQEAVAPPVPPVPPPWVISPSESWGWDGMGYGGFPGPQQASAYRGFGFLREPGWTRYAYYGGWGFRAPGFSANFAPYAVRPLPPLPQPPATLIITVPADSKLTIDDRPTTQTSDTRTFVARNLNPGYTYYYQLKAEVVRDGQTQHLSKRVAVRPGEVTRVDLNPPAPAITSR